MRKTILFVLAMLATSLSAQQLQTPNLKFGKPTNEELTMTTYDHDTSAVAVVLCQLTDVKYNVSENLDMDQNTYVKTRIKILKPDGLKYANISIKYYSKADDNKSQENISGLKVVTYNKVGNKVNKTSVPGKMIFDKDLGNGHHSIDCSAVDVKVGSVIEYTYTKWSNIWFSVDNYYAQQRIPVAYCHYFAEIPAIIQLNVQYTKNGDFNGTVKGGSMNIPASNYAKHPTVDTNIYEATGHFLSALKDNDYLYCPEDYSAHVSNELRQLQFPGEMTRIISNSWKDVDKLLLESDVFGAKLNDHSKLRDEINASGIATIPDFKKKIASLYQLMCKHVTWNGKYRLSPDPDNNPLKTGSGTSADLNMLFISMLNDLGITNYPVVMSTRSNGMISPYYANFEHLNAFIVAVTDGEKTYYIDSSVKNGYLNVLPSELLVPRARKIGKKVESEWINLQDLPAAQKMITEDISVSPDGTATSQYTAKYFNNASASVKSRYREAKDSTSWVSKIANDNNVNISQYSLEGTNVFSPDATEKMSFTRQLDTTDSIIYINPLSINNLDSNPFTEPKRELPLEFPYKEKITYMVSIAVPEGYEPVDLPKPERVMTKDRGLNSVVNYQYNPANRKLQVLLKYDINKMFFNADEYSDIKTMFDHIVESANSTIVLKKL